jgi:alpha-L-fucosidase
MYSIFIKKQKLKLLQFLLIIFFISSFLITSCSENEKKEESNNSQTDRMEWFRDAKFGLFIHWGLYSIPAGVWNGKEIPGIGEWIMNHAKIPVKEYAKLAKEFNPIKFDADKWVKMAKDAGMKYVVITAKHHDGFAMFHSKVSPYNIVDATPFKRDPMKELSDACKKYGLRFGFYYSQTQDWHEQNAAGNDWDFIGDNPPNFTQYLNDKVIPQVKELLTNYGPISVLWFDTPRFMTVEQSKELANLVHKLQPNCLIDGRIGNDMGDFKTKGDNKIPTGATSSDWDTPVTMNDTWGYKKNDHNWKSVTQLIRAVVEVASKGGTYLLNVGPTSEGVIPQPSVDRLQEIGKWIKENGEAVYGTRMSPFIEEPQWGMITVKPGKMFLNVFSWPKDGTLELYGLRNKVNKVSLFSKKEELSFKQTEDKSLDHQELIINVPSRAPDSIVSVVELDLDGNADVNNQIEQQPDGTIILNGIQANLYKSSDSAQIKIDDTGILDWMNTKNWVSWDFVVTKPGSFKVALGSFEVKRGSGRSRKTIYEGGHKMMLSIASQNLNFNTETKINNVEKPSPYFTDIVSNAGRIVISKPGRYTLNLKAEKLNTKKDVGLTLRWIRLKPVK